MARYGNTPILLPKGVEVKLNDKRELVVKGPKGSLNINLPIGLELKIENGKVLLQKDKKGSVPAVIHGLKRSELNNSVVGVSEGFEKRLTLIGVGYRANLKGTKLDLQLGLSHPCEIDIPQGIQVKIDKNVEIIISGVDKQVVGQFAATIRSKKPPEPYKGKGIRYKDEYVRKKDGKAAKGKGAAGA